ncbi:UvrB/UvrC motif-containing protein [Patescibacteria group bacterium]|nr:UvrB/UvrC motif-containing protein [Patescibacteria group bacterium]
MYWANFLHIYQPSNQMPDILERITNESYRKLFRGLLANPKAKLTLNINAGLTEQLDRYGYTDIIRDIKKLAERGQIEFTESAKYHPFMPLTPWEENERQIKLNHETNKFYFGKIYKPLGFFPPEMAYSRKVADLVSSLGYRWMVADEISYNGKTEQLSYDKTYTIKGLNNFKIFFRDRRVSNLIMSAVVRTGKSLLEAVGEEKNKNRYLLTAMDGETFGHHRPGLDQLLFEILSSPKFKKITLSEIAEKFPTKEVVDPIDSTWASSEDDIKRGVQFLSWNDPENPIHAWQWEFTGFVLKIVEKLDKKKPYYKIARAKMDEALHSCQYWWASGKPWWSLEMIESGAWKLLDVLYQITNLSEKNLETGKDFYQRIVLKAFEWQRTGYIRKLAGERGKEIKLPFKKRSLEAGKPEVYYAFIKTMDKEMMKAVKNKEFERAILWRDAILKIENQDDIYDAVHATDLLRMSVPGGDLEKLMDKYKTRYRKMRGGQPEQRG